MVNEIKEKLNVLIQENVSQNELENVKTALISARKWKSIYDIVPLKKGMTNELFTFRSNGEIYLLRLSGPGSDKLINREHEANVYRTLQWRHITEDVLFIDPDTGIKISKFLENARPCDANNKDEVVKCMKYLRHVHDLNLKVEHEFNLRKKIEIYEKHYKSTNNMFPDYAEVRKNVFSLCDMLEKREGKKHCLCHIDSVHDNMLIFEDNIYLIDWEYSGMCDPLIDIGMYAIYAYYSKEQTDFLIDAYFDGKVDDNTRKAIYAYMSACAYLWVLWCEVKRDSGTDYDQYEKEQFRLSKEYYKYATE